MRFKLVENRIDDLKRMIQKDVDQKNVEKEIPYSIDRISLLSEEEAEKIKDDNGTGLFEYNILLWPSRNRDWSSPWWLRSPGYNSYYAAYVYNGGGSVNNSGRIVRDVSGVRPALYLNSKILNKYQEYAAYGEPWIAISEDTLLYDGNKLIEHRFDEETNIYEDSEIKRYVENEWLNDLKDSSKYHISYWEI